MDIHKNLDLIKTIAVQKAKEHGCNYNIIIVNPDSKNKFNEAEGSTYEFVTDTYFYVPRPEAIMVTTTDKLIASEPKNNQGQLKL